MNLNYIPHVPGVYLMRDVQGKIIYVGKAKDLKKRVSSYFRRDVSDLKLTALLSSIRRIDYIAVASERESLLLEQKLIRRLQPFYNVMWRDDKSYPYVKCTFNEDYPRLILTRQKQKDKGRYFGPYPNVSTVKKLLRTLWKKKFFPLRPCSYDFKKEEIHSKGGLEQARPTLFRKVKSCIYLHTGDCPAPCVGRVSREDYLQIAHRAGLFFKGKTQDLLQEWEKEMKESSEALNYEKAQDLRDRIFAVQHMNENVSIRQVDESSLDVHMRRSRSLTLLKEVLQCPTPPLRIEGFDISNIQSTEPVASLVVFHGGRPLKSEYRKFKIKTAGGQDDFRMIQEVVTRRYRRVIEDKKKLPDLVLIDGGKGQLSAAMKSFKEIHLDKKIGKQFAVASLAKGNEEVYLPGRSEPVRLPKDSPALHILQAVRDEAHRFAITFHRQRRRKKTLGI